MSCGTQEMPCQSIHDYGTKLNAAPDDPFLCAENIHEPPSKGSMVETFRMVARELGWDVAETKNMTGHALRATGAQYLARCGLNITKFSSFVDGAATPYFVPQRCTPGRLKLMNLPCFRTFLSSRSLVSDLLGGQSKSQGDFGAGY